MLDICDFECIWTGYPTFNECVQSPSAHSTTGWALRIMLKDNLRGWYV